MDWLASNDGFDAAVGVERARRELLCIVKKGDVFRKKLKAAQQACVEATHQADINVKYRRRHAASLKLNKHNKYEHEPRTVFQNLWLKATCDQLYHTLPRELRDMIYSHIMGDSVLDQFCNSRYSAKHIQNMELMGHDVVRELIQTLCRTACFNHPLTTKGSLHEFLSRDKWGLGLRLFDYIKTVEMNIYETYFTRRKLHENLKTLCHLKKCKRVYVVLERKMTPGRYRFGSLFLFLCSRCGGKPPKLYLMPHADLLAFFHKLRKLLPILCQIHDAGIVLDIAFDVPNWGVKVDFFKHGSGMSLDTDNTLDSFMQKQREIEAITRLCRCKEYDLDFNFDFLTPHID